MAKYLDQGGLEYFWGKINDKLAGKLEKGQISFTLNQDTKNLVLSDGTKEQSIPLSDLYDGVIDSVQLVDNKLQITTTSGGTFEVDLSSLNVNDTTSTVTVSNQIQVTGTPLADIFNACGVDNIDPGKNLQDLLVELLCKEVWPEAISITNPSASITFKDVTSTNAGKTYEVGETVEATANSATNPISVSKVDAKVDNLTYGYKLTSDGALEKDTLYTVPTVVNFAEGTVDISYNGGVDTSSAGDNKSFAVIQTPQNYTFSYSNDGITLYPASNLGNTKEDNKQTIASVNESPAIGTKSTTIRYNVKYKYYIGTAATDPTNKTTLQGLTKLAGLSTNNEFLENIGTTTIVNEKTIVKTDGNSLYIAIPASYTISSIKSSLGADVSGTLIKNTFNYNGTGDYEFYKLPVIGGANVELKDIKITKK